MAEKKSNITKRWESDGGAYIVKPAPKTNKSKPTTSKKSKK